MGNVIKPTAGRDGLFVGWREMTTEKQCRVWVSEDKQGLSSLKMSLTWKCQRGQSVEVAWQSAPTVRLQVLPYSLCLPLPVPTMMIHSEEKGLSALGMLLRSLKDGPFALTFCEITKTQAQKSRNQTKTTAQPKPKNTTQHRGCLWEITCF